MKRILVLLSCVVFASCHIGGKKDPSSLRVGAMAGPESELVEAAASVAREKYGLAVKVVTFTDYVSPNEALASRQIDANAFQHQPYLDEFQKTRGMKFSIIGKTFLYPMGVYSKKIKSLEAIPEKGKVALPNDPSNEGRALLILEQAGLIQVKKDKGVLATVHDVVANPKKLQFLTLEAAQLPRSLEDVDCAVINTNYAKPAGLTHEKDVIFVEQTSSPYTNVIVAREDNHTDPRLAKFVKSYHTSQVAQKAKELFGDQAIPAFTLQ